MSLALWHWHIEISSKCTLRCPRCARSEVPESLVNTELGLDFFIKNFDESFIKNHVEKLTFCGDDGDPIYAHDFLSVLKYFKNIKPNISIVIVTNGGYKSNDFWNECSNILNEYDTIHFSLDGWDNASNNLYRVNSNFDSSINGAKILIESNKCYVVWDAIGFKFNENKLRHMKQLAKSYGFDMFQLTKSTKFGAIYEHYGKNDTLQPSKKLMSSSHRFEREYTYFTERRPNESFMTTNLSQYDSVENIGNIKPLCHIGNKGLFINSKGEFFPCCWVANRYGHNNKFVDLSKSYNLHNVTLQSVLDLDFYKKNFVNDSFECNIKCNKDIVTKNYGTEW